MSVAAHQTTTELCKVLLTYFYGPTVAVSYTMSSEQGSELIVSKSIAGTLLLYGRLEAATISRKAEVSPKLTRQSLAVLIQQNFVQFTSTNENDSERTYYECNWQEVMELLTNGKVMYWASKEVSSEAAALVKYVSFYGKAKARDITSAFKSTGSADRESAAQTRMFEDTLLQLLQSRILRVAPLHESKPVEDFKQSIRLEELRSFHGQSIPETRKAKEVEARLQRRLDELQNTSNSPDLGLKRKADLVDGGRAKKRVKRDEDESQSVVDPDVMLRVNHDKFHVHQRNAALVELCRARLGPTPAEVYRHILQEIEPKIFRCRQDTSDIVITTLTISRALPASLDLSSVWAESSSNGNGNGKVRKDKTRKDKTTASHKYNADEDESEEDEDEDEDMDEMDSADESFIEDDDHLLPDDDEYNPRNEKYLSGAQGVQNADRIKLTNQFCDLLAGDSLKFLRKLGTKAMGEWHVNYEALGDTLRQFEIEAIVQQKFGDLAPRLLRIVKDKVKIDEKQLSTIALLKQKDIRHVLTSMHKAGALDLQEVPKRLDRQPSMTFFLWFHNPSRAISCLSQDICKAICRIYQRLHHELEARKRLLDKAQRTDVRNKEAEYLSRDELQALRQIRLVEERLLAQSARLAQSYAILMHY